MKLPKSTPTLYIYICYVRDLALRLTFFFSLCERKIINAIQ